MCAPRLTGGRDPGTEPISEGVARVRTQDIDVILAIRETGSFSRAADRLALSQPAVSLAVKRVEEEFGVRVFDRSGACVTLTAEGHRVLRGFERIVEILDGIRGVRADGETLRIGLSPLLSGRDVAALLGNAIVASRIGFTVEFLESDEIAARSDFDVRVMLPALRRRAPVRIQLETHWIGADNGVFIRSRQERQVWDRAMHVLADQGMTIARVIEVNDCGYAYHMASSGAGFTPCVMSNGNGFRASVLPHLPPLAPITLDISAPPEIASHLKSSLEAGSRAEVQPRHAVN